MEEKIFKKVAVVLYFVMFIYSGFNKIIHFQQKVNILGKKTFLPYFINVIGMVGVLLLEIIGSLAIILYSIYPIKKYKKFIQVSYILFLIFLVVVTALYHPPSAKKMIPFLSNLTHFSGLLYLFIDLE